MLAGQTLYTTDFIPDASTAYTPAITATGTAFALGSGTAAGFYAQVGCITWFQAKITMAADTTMGTGFWCVSLPTTPIAEGLLLAYADDTSTAHRTPMVARITSASATGSNMRIACDDNVTGGVGPTSPITWATGDSLLIAGWYFTA